jgi:hypothetical protein
MLVKAPSKENAQIFIIFFTQFFLAILKNLYIVSVKKQKSNKEIKRMYVRPHHPLSRPSILCFFFNNCYVLKLQAVPLV